LWEKRGGKKKKKEQEKRCKETTTAISHAYQNKREPPEPEKHRKIGMQSGRKN